MSDEAPRRDACWYCGGQLIWDSDFNADEAYGDGDGKPEGIVSYLHCARCGARVEYTLIEDDELETDRAE